jgi:hypothetical protein
MSVGSILRRELQPRNLLAVLAVVLFAYWAVHTNGTKMEVGPSRQTVLYPVKDKIPPLNPDFLGRESSEQNVTYFESVWRSASGYPIASVNVDIPMCASPFQIKEALDAWKASDLNWLEKINSCTLVSKGTRVEWLQLRASGVNDTLQFRIVRPDGTRLKIYGPGGIDRNKSADYLGLFPVASTNLTH